MITPDDPKLTAYLLDELDPSDAQAVRQAIEDSPELQMAVDQLRQTIGRLEEGFRDEPAIELTGAQRKQILTQAESEAGQLTPPVVPPTNRRMVETLVVGAVALVLIGILVVPGVQRSRSSSSTRGSRDATRRPEPSVTAPTNNTPADNTPINNPDSGNALSRNGRIQSHEERPPSIAGKVTEEDEAMYRAAGSDRQAAGSDRQSAQEVSQSALPAGNEDGFADDFAKDTGGAGAAPSAPSGMPASGPAVGDSVWTDDAPMPATGRLPAQVGGSAVDLDETEALGTRLQSRFGREEQRQQQTESGLGFAGQALPAEQPTPDTTTSFENPPATPELAEAEQPAPAAVPNEEASEPEVAGNSQGRGVILRGSERDVKRVEAMIESIAGTREPLESAPQQVLERLRKLRDLQTSPTTEEGDRRQALELFEREVRAFGEDPQPSAANSRRSRTDAEAGAADAAQTDNGIERLADLILSTVQSDSWTELSDEQKLSLIVRQTQRLEETVEAARPEQTEAQEAQDKRRRSWRRSKATPNASRLTIGDDDGLPLEGMQVNVMVDGFRARVVMDLYFYNDRPQQLEGSFQLRLPNEASLYYFAFGDTTYEYRPMVDQLAAKGFLSADVMRAVGTGPREIFRARKETWGNVKEARIVPREKAAHAYGETVRRKVDPALVEWAGAGTFNAKVFPLLPKKLHRVVVGYDMNLEQADDRLSYRFELPAEVPECTVDVDVAALPGSTAEVMPETRPFVSGGRAFYHFQNPQVAAIDVKLAAADSNLIVGQDQLAGEFFATRFTPQLPAAAASQSAAHAIYLLDTSLSSNPDKFNVWLKLLAASLAENRDSIDKFGVLMFDVHARWWKPEFVDNTEANVKRLLADCHQISLEGATNLGLALAEATEPEWLAGEKLPAVDLFLLSDGAATWGEANVHAIAAHLSSAPQATLFAYKTGLAGTAVGALEQLARDSGGAVFAIAAEAEIVTASTAHRQRPWELVAVEAAGATDLLVAGRPRLVYPDQSLLVVGRGKPTENLRLMLKRGEESFEVDVPLVDSVESDLVARLYGQVAVGQLEGLGSQIEDVAIAYARHFRVTGQTCSLLMLESEADYQRFNIKPEDDAFVVTSSPAAALILQKLDELADTLTDPKSAMTSWLAKLERVPGLQFSLPTALKLALERLPEEAFAVPPANLAGKEVEPDSLPGVYRNALGEGQLTYDLICAEADRRQAALGPADGLRTLSNLIEQKPGDLILMRDVAFSAIQWKLPAQAYPLLKRVVEARPYEPPTYLAIGQCLAEMGRADLAMLYFEVALNGKWHSRYCDVNRIAAVQYLRLLRRVAAGELQTHAPNYAQARLASLEKTAPFTKADLVVTLQWNVDRTDVDLHIKEPSGEECYYKNPNTRAGGHITGDVTQGLGPEMYWNTTGRRGTYQVLANYFGTDANRTGARAKLLVTTYQGFGSDNESVSRHTVRLGQQSEKRDVVSIKYAD